MKKSKTSQLPNGGTMTTSIKDGQKTITISGGNNIRIAPRTGQVSSASPTNFFSNNPSSTSSQSSGKNVTVVTSGISIKKVTSLTLDKQELGEIFKNSNHTNYKTSDDYLKASSSGSTPKPSKS